MSLPQTQPIGTTINAPSINGKFPLTVHSVTMQEQQEPAQTNHPLTQAAAVLFPALASTYDHAEQKTLRETLRSLYNLASDEDKQSFATIAYKSFKRGEDAKSFLESCQATGEANPFLEVLTMDDVMSRPPKEWLVENLLGKGDIGMVFSAAGGGKTFFTIDLIGAMCTGEQFAQRFSVSHPLTVGYTAGEGLSGLPSRFKAMMQARGITSLPNFYLWMDTPKLYMDNKGNSFGAHMKLFIDAYKKGQAEGKLKALDVLIIDTFHTAAIGANENDSGDMGIAVDACRQAVKELGCAVLIIHHTGKNGEDYRGSSALHGAMDTMIKIKRISDASTKSVVSCYKLKDSEAWKPLTFDLVSMNDSAYVWWDESTDDATKGKQENDKERILQEFAHYQDRTFNAKQIAEIIGKGDVHTRNLLSKMVDSGQIVRQVLDKTANKSNQNPWVYGYNSSLHKPVTNQSQTSL